MAIANVVTLGIGLNAGVIGYAVTLGFGNLEAASTTYTVLGALSDPAERMAFSDPSVRMVFSDPREND